MWILALSYNDVLGITKLSMYLILVNIIAYTNVSLTITTRKQTNFKVVEIIV